MAVLVAIIVDIVSTAIALQVEVELPFVAVLVIVIAVVRSLPLWAWHGLLDLKEPPDLLVS